MGSAGRMAGRSVLAWAAAAVLAWGAQGRAAQPAPKVIDDPQWVQAGAPEGLGDLFPARAKAAGLSTGRARLDCVADRDGRMTGCAVLSEDPVGMGFGEAALTLAATMAIAPRTADGQSVEGAHVRFAVRVNKAEAPAAPGAAASTAQRVIRNPSWRRTPNEAESRAAYPSYAISRGVNGRVLLRCLVREDGHLTDCVVLLENPPGLGFAQGALKLASKYEIGPTAEDGKPTAGALVELELDATGANLSGNGLVIRPIWAAAPSKEDVEAARAMAGAADLPARMVFNCLAAADGALNHCRSIGPGDPKAVLGAASGLLAKFRLEMSGLKGRFTTVELAIQWSAAPEPAAPIPDPRWVQGPAASALGSAFPAKAVALGLAHGRAGLSCLADRLGRMTQCQVVGEDPPGAGFGEAAVMLSKDMALNLWTEDGRPVEGQRVGFTIPFNRVGGEAIGSDLEFADVIWARQPSGARGAYPKTAQKKGVTGAGAVRCTIGRDGALTGCKVIFEDPPGYEFGAATMGLAGQYKASPKTRSGAATAGRTVVVRTNFRLN